MNWHRMHNQTVQLIRADFTIEDEVLRWCASHKIPFSRLLTEEDEAGLGFVLPGKGILDIVRAGDYICTLPNGTYCSISPAQYEKNCVPLYKKDEVGQWTVTFKKVGNRYVLHKHTIPTYHEIQDTFGVQVTLVYKTGQHCLSYRDERTIVIVDEDGSSQEYTYRETYTKEEMGFILTSLRECRQRLTGLVQDFLGSTIEEHTI